MATVYLLSQANDAQAQSRPSAACINRLFEAVQRFLETTSVTIQRAQAFPTEVFTLTPEEKRTTLALYADAKPENDTSDSEVYYDASSFRSFTLAQLMQENLSDLTEVDAEPYTSADLLGSFLRQLPSVMLRFGTHSQGSGVTLLCTDIDAFAWEIALAIASYFNVVIIQPTPPRTATVELESGTLNMREYPAVSAPVLARVPNGTALPVYARVGDWYLVNYNDQEGYVNGQYIVLQY